MGATTRLPSCMKKKKYSHEKRVSFAWEELEKRAKALCDKKKDAENFNIPDRVDQVMKDMDMNNMRFHDEQAARKKPHAQNDFLPEKYKANKAFLQDISENPVHDFHIFENPVHDFDTFGDPLPQVKWFTRKQIQKTTWINVEGFLRATFDPDINAILTGCPPPQLTHEEKAKSLYFFVEDQKLKERRYMSQFGFTLFADIDLFAYMPGPINVQEARIIPIHT